MTLVRARVATLTASLAVAGLLAGCVLQASPEPPGERAEPAGFGTIHFPPREFPAGAVAFLIELGPAPRTVVDGWHKYERGGWGSSPDHAANFLVPLETLEAPYDLRPGQIPDPPSRLEWGHVYRSATLHGTAHAASLRAGEHHVYLNPNDESPPVWRRVGIQGNLSDEGKPLREGLHWWAFAATVPHSVEFRLTNARLLAGPIPFGHQEWHAFSGGDFDSALTASSHPTPGVGLYGTAGATLTVATQGPAYVFAQAIHHNATAPLFSLRDPLGDPVEMRQKFYAAEGVFAAGAFAGIGLRIPQADLLFPTAGTWRVHVEGATGDRFEFLLYVLALSDLLEPPA